MVDDKYKDLAKDLLNSYKQSSDYKDRQVYDIAFNRFKYEDNLNEMWNNYARGCVSQIVEYNKAVDRIKSCGFKVLRNSKGLHKITWKDD